MKTKNFLGKTCLQGSCETQSRCEITLCLINHVFVPYVFVCVIKGELRSTIVCALVNHVFAVCPQSCHVRVSLVPRGNHEGSVRPQPMSSTIVCALSSTSL
jgi:hypothetical protein